MNKKEGFSNTVIENPEEAHVVALAAKPIIDAARAGFVTEKEKKNLDRLAMKISDRAQEDFHKNLSTQEIHGGNELGEKMIHLIETSPYVNFFVCGVGNVLNEKNHVKRNAETYIFNKKSKAMQVGLSGSIRLDGTYLEVRNDKLFKPNYTIKDDGDARYIIKRLPINTTFGAKENPFISDNRGGVHLTLAIQFYKKPAA